MPDTKTSQEQAKEQAAKTPAEQRSEQDRQAEERKEEAKSAAEKVLSVDRSESSIDPYPAYDLMSLDDLRSLADERGVVINPDVEKAHLVTELRAADTGTLSASTRKGAR
jgi:hypothetical protein